MEKIIEVNDVSKTFKHKNAVNNVSFHVNKGEIVALLGPNGAGKTTTMSMMLGLKEPTEGKVSIFGKSPKHRDVRNSLGAMLQEVSVIDSITVEEAIELFRSYYTNPIEKETLLQLSNLESERKQRCEKLSGGQKRRLNFALALAGNPDLLFLDEPTVGMDITSRRTFWETIRKLASEGKTIISNNALFRRSRCFSKSYLIICERKDYRRCYTRRNESNDFEKNNYILLKGKHSYKITKGITKCNRSKVKRRTLHFNNGGYGCNFKSHLSKEFTCNRCFS